MKKLVAAIIVCSGVIGQAQAESYPAHVENDLIAICEAIKSDNKLQLHRAVRSSGYKYSTIGKGLVCNGMNVAEFAAHHEAFRTSKLITKRMNVSADSMLAKRF